MHTRLVALITVIFCTAGAYADGDSATGKNAYAAKGCAACHGVDGKATIAPTYPKLAGQNAEYTVLQLRAFKSGERNNPLMTPMGALLSDAEMADIAAYLASLE